MVYLLYCGRTLSGLRNAGSAQIVFVYICSFLGGKFDYSRHANLTVATNMTTADLHVSCAFYLKTQTLTQVPHLPRRRFLNYTCI